MTRPTVASLQGELKKAHIRIAELEAKPEFPYEDGASTVLGPEIFAGRREDTGAVVISWKGENFEPQLPPAQRPENLSQIMTAKQQALEIAVKERERARTGWDEATRKVQDLTQELDRTVRESGTRGRTINSLQEMVESLRGERDAKILQIQSLANDVVRMREALYEIAEAKWPRLSSPLIKRAQQVLDESSELDQGKLP